MEWVFQLCVYVFLPFVLHSHMYFRPRHLMYFRIFRKNASVPSPSSQQFDQSQRRRSSATLTESVSLIQRPRFAARRNRVYDLRLSSFVLCHS
ncbi:hypothetical protein BDN70DRAFT_514959 [Pholiota conissans]|uniref:Uncharacterized protein n=1 Tax=Pholiota conissans TaxID=109636 RepID=A0A9P5YQT7_9AGAR|nr:hypothetical protein BDN70DRAFT_514959 [Pholiota conissans]